MMTMMNTIKLHASNNRVLCDWDWRWFTIYRSHRKLVYQPHAALTIKRYRNNVYMQQHPFFVVCCCWCWNGVAFVTQLKWYYLIYFFSLNRDMKFFLLFSILVTIPSHALTWWCVNFPKLWNIRLVIWKSGNRMSFHFGYVHGLNVFRFNGNWCAISTHYCWRNWEKKSHISNTSAQFKCSISSLRNGKKKSINNTKNFIFDSIWKNLKDFFYWLKIQMCELNICLCVWYP